jgi:alanine racemase
MSDNTGTVNINLAAIAANWRAVAAEASAAITSAVIKADAYGLGAERVVPVLYRAGCRHFFVATLKEALSVRALLGVDAKCYLLGGVAAGAESAATEYGLVPVLSSVAAVNRWLAWRDDAGLNAQQAPAALKFDTGMTRLGLSVPELEQLLHDKGRWAALAPVLLMSHLAVADEADHPQNRQQRDLFFALGERAKQLQPDILLSLANSCGVYLGRDYHADLVRPGAALYGYNPAPLQPSPVVPVVSLALPVLSLRGLKEPALVGYGAESQADKGQVLAVAAGGYADGLHRILGRAGFGYCRGKKVPVVGRVSMDTCVFDVTAALGPNDAASGPLCIEVVNSEALTLDALTLRNRALGYEVLTSLRAGRYARVYQTEGD